METLENKIYKEAQELEKNGSLSAAIQKYQELLIQNPKSLILLQTLGKCYFKQKDFSNALKYFQQVTSIYPSEANYQKEAECYLSLGKNHEAIQSLKRAVSINPVYVKANTLLAKIYSQIGNLYNQEKYLQMILKADPKNTFALREMASLCEKTNRPKEGLSYIEGYIYQNKENVVQAEILRVRLLLQMGKYASAWEHLYESMQQNFSAYYNIRNDKVSTLQREIHKLYENLKTSLLEKKPAIALQISILYLMLGNIEKSSKYLIYSEKLKQDFKLSKVKIDISE